MLCWVKFTRESLTAHYLLRLRRSRDRTALRDPQPRGGISWRLSISHRKISSLPLTVVAAIASGRLQLRMTVPIPTPSAKVLSLKRLASRNENRFYAGNMQMKREDRSCRSGSKLGMKSSTTVAVVFAIVYVLRRTVLVENSYCHDEVTILLVIVMPTRSLRGEL